MSKLEYLLEKTPPEQLRAFRKQLSAKASPRQKVLRKLLSETQKGAVPGPDLYEKLYPGQAFSEKQLRNLRSDLHGKLWNFHTWETFQESPEKVLLEVRTLSRLRGWKYAKNFLEKAQARVEQMPESRHKLQLAALLEMELVPIRLARFGRKGLSFTSVIEKLEEAFVVQMLGFGLAEKTALATLKGSKSEIDNSFLDTIIQKIQGGAWINNSLLQLFAQAYNLSDFSSISELENFTQDLILSAKKTQNEEFLDLYRVCLNQCIKRLNLGQSEVLSLIFSLDKKLLEIGTLPPESGFTPWHFKAIASFAVRLGENEWVRNFVKEFGPTLPGGETHPMTSFCLGLADFFDRNWNASERWMNHTLQENQDSFVELDVRTYLLRIYYEKEDSIGMESMAESFRVFLKRNRHLSSQRLLGYRRFLSFFKRLVLLKPGDMEKINQLKNDILQAPKNMPNEWLLKKLPQ